MFANANVVSNKEFPAYDTNDLLMLTACCEQDISCCVDFSENNSLEEFKSKVKAINNIRDRATQQILNNTQTIKNRLDKRIRQRELERQQMYNRYQNIGNFNHNN